MACRDEGLGARPGSGEQVKDEAGLAGVDQVEFPLIRVAPPFSTACICIACRVALVPPYNRCGRPCLVSLFWGA